VDNPGESLPDSLSISPAHSLFTHSLTHY